MRTWPRFGGAGFAGSGSGESATAQTPIRATSMAAQNAAIPGRKCLRSTGRPR